MALILWWSSHKTADFVARKNLNQAFWSQSYEFLILRKTLHFYNFEDADIKYDNTFSNLLPKISK